MRAKVLRAFPLSHDGIHATDHQPGDVVDVPGDLHPGLLKEGWIEAMEQPDLLDEGAETADDKVTIPEKGETEPAPARRGRKKAEAA